MNWQTREVHDIDVGAKSPVRVSVSSSGGQTYYDVRKIYLEGGEVRPSAKGISLTAQQWAEILPVLETLIRGEI